MILRLTAAAILSLIASVAFAEATDSVGSMRQIPEVVVTGSNDAVGRNLLPYTVTTVGRTQLTATGNTRLLSAVSSLVPGMFVTERNILGFGVSNGGSGGIKIRGVGGSPTNAVLMMVDGQPQFAGIYSHHVADFYATEYADRVEVLRGPASVLYGSNAMGGVINVITRQPKGRGVHTSLTSQYGSYNTWLTALTNALRFGRFSSFISLSYDRTDGVRKNFDFSQVGGYAKVGYDFSSRWALKADYSLTQFQGNDPVYPTLSNPESTAIYHQKIIRGESSLTLSNSYDTTGGALRVYYSYGNHIVDDPNHFRSTDDRLGVIAYQNFTPWSGARATLGFDFDRYTGRIPVSGGKPHAPGSLSTMDRKAITEYSPYLTLSQSLFRDWLVLNAGLRMANSNLFHTQWIPQGGAVVRFPREWNLKLSVAKGFRNPSFRELYLYRTANPDLEPENMVNYEVSLGHQFNRYFGFDLTGYFSRGRNMIQTVMMHNVNTGRFVNKGIELSMRSHPIDRLQLWATYSYLHSSVKNLTGAPTHQYYLGASWTPIARLNIDAELKGAAGLYLADELPRKSYATVNLRVAYQLIKQLQLFVRLDNITNTRYQLTYGYPMPRFTTLGGFRLTLS